VPHHRHGRSQHAHLDGHDHGSARPDIAALQAAPVHHGRRLVPDCAIPGYELRHVTQNAALDVLRNALTLTLVLSAPVLAFGLLVGLMVSIFQAVTQINEMTLAYIPKILAVFVALAIF